MGRLINVLTDEEQAVKNCISVLEEYRSGLREQNSLLSTKRDELQKIVRDLERQEEKLRGKIKSSKLERFKEDKAYPKPAVWEAYQRVKANRGAAHDSSYKRTE